MWKLINVEADDSEPSLRHDFPDQLPPLTLPHSRFSPLSYNNWVFRPGQRVMVFISVDEKGNPGSSALWMRSGRSRISKHALNDADTWKSPAWGMASPVGSGQFRPA